MPGAQKIGPAFLGPGIAGGKITDMRLFWFQVCERWIRRPFCPAHSRRIALASIGVSWIVKCLAQRGWLQLSFQSLPARTLLFCQSRLDRRHPLHDANLSARQASAWKQNSFRNHHITWWLLPSKQAVTARLLHWRNQRKPREFGRWNLETPPFESAIKSRILGVSRWSPFLKSIRVFSVVGLAVNSD